MADVDRLEPVDLLVAEPPGKPAGQIAPHLKNQVDRGLVRDHE